MGSLYTGTDAHLSRKVHHGVDLLGLEDVCEQIAALQIALDELQSQ